MILISYTQAKITIRLEYPNICTLLHGNFPYEVHAVCAGFLGHKQHGFPEGTYM